MGRTVTTISASASVNPLMKLTHKKSGVLQFALMSSALDIWYGEYRKLDYNSGASAEINKAFRVGQSANSTVHFVDQRGALPPPMEDPAVDYDTSGYSVDVVLEGAKEDLGFMPMVMIKSDDYKEGVIKAPKGNADREKAERVSRAMNLDLAEISEALIGIPKVPAVGTPEWSKYRKQQRNSDDAGMSEAGYHKKAKDAAKEKKKAMEDITDMAIGYFGKFSVKNTVMPEAMYYTILECLEKSE